MRKSWPVIRTRLRVSHWLLIGCLPVAGTGGLLLAAKQGPPTMRGAALQGAGLQRAHLSQADLRGINLENGSLAGANLEGADLRAAILTGANLREADLRGAQLQGSDLSGADLLHVRLNGARYDAATRWPAGFDPQSHGGISTDEPVAQRLNGPTAGGSG